MKNNILGKLTAKQFLKDYWQKKPLLIRSAFPDFSGIVTKTELMSLACSDDVQARLVSYARGQWQVLQGPIHKRDLAKPKGAWTLLVQNINHFFSDAQVLLKKFNFIPHARLDDLMVSYAPDGGGVGPHFDSYDVFLLQGTGQRLWQIAKQKDKSLVPDAPLRILKNFKAQEEWLLSPGDMLYLPPLYAHNGIAVGDCMTYSIGFRAPTHQELINEFLIYLQDHLEIGGIYTDPNLKMATHPAHISDEMVSKVAAVLKKIRFGKREIKNFLGAYLTEPKAHLFFDPPTSPLHKKHFLQSVKNSGVELAFKSQMLFNDESIFINGEVLPFYSAGKSFLQKLADEREIKPDAKIDNKTADILYEWYLNGYLFPRSIK